MQQAEDYDEVLKALYGEETRFLRQLNNGKKMFSVAIPVQSYKKISGAIIAPAALPQSIATLIFLLILILFTMSSTYAESIST